MAATPRELAYALLWQPALKSVLGRLPLARRIYAGWSRVHPYDIANGVDTSGYVAPADCTADGGLAAHISPYGGSQPSILRRSLALLPEPERYSFVDIGCGKGRPLLVAAEFPFRELLGIEISPDLAALARANGETLSRRNPGRPPIQIQEGDATAVIAPGPCAVLYMYHAFDAGLVEALLANLGRQLALGLEHAFLVYYNPVHADRVDRSGHFVRWSAATLPYAADELGYGPDIRDTVVIWQTRPERYPPRPGASAPVVVDAGGLSTRLGSAG